MLNSVRHFNFRSPPDSLIQMVLMTEDWRQKWIPPLLSLLLSLLTEVLKCSEERAESWEQREQRSKNTRSVFCTPHFLYPHWQDLGSPIPSILSDQNHENSNTVIYFEDISEIFKIWSRRNCTHHWRMRPRGWCFGFRQQQLLTSTLKWRISTYTSLTSLSLHTSLSTVYSFNIESAFHILH